MIIISIIVHLGSEFSNSTDHLFTYETFPFFNHCYSYRFQARTDPPFNLHECLKTALWCIHHCLITEVTTEFPRPPVGERSGNKNSFMVYVSVCNRFTLQIHKYWTRQALKFKNSSVCSENSKTESFVIKQEISYIYRYIQIKYVKYMWRFISLFLQYIRYK